MRHNYVQHFSKYLIEKCGIFHCYGIVNSIQLIVFSSRKFILYYSFYQRGKFDFRIEILIAVYFEWGFSLKAETDIQGDSKLSMKNEKEIKRNFMSFIYPYFKISLSP